MSRIAAAAFAAALGLWPALSEAAPPPGAAPAKVAGDLACRLAPDDLSWLTRAPSTWALVEERAFHLKPMSPLPGFVFFDKQCVYASTDGLSWTGASHSGFVRTPDGQDIPVQVTSFAAPRKDGGPFMVMALPSIWKAGGVTSDMGLDKMMFAVFDHEMAHTRQFADYDPQLEALSKQWALPSDLDDDAVQERFKDEPRFAAAVRAESDLMFAAAAGNAGSARAKAKEALGMIRARGAQWYVGADRKYADLEDIFLTLEGIGQFAGYAWLVDPKGAGLSASKAIPGMRRTKRPWSQDEGLAIMLLVQKLTPNWPKRAFGPRPESALKLLARAAGEP